MQTRFTNRLFTSAALAACAVALIAVKPASAQTEAIRSFASTQAFQLSGFSVGYNFTLSSAVTVTGLGYFDLLGDGLAEAHQVAIYDQTTGTQLFTATVGTGTTSPLGNTFFGPNNVGGNGFRFAAVTGPATVLSAGSYTIAGYSGNISTTGTGGADAFFYNATSVVSNSPVSVGAGVATSTPGGLSATAPRGGGTGASYFGPSFRFATNSAPEPGTFALLGTGLLSMGGIAIRRKKSAK